MSAQTTGDIRVDEIMPHLNEVWAKIPFEKCLLPAEANYRKLKQKEFQPTGLIPVIDQGEDFIAGYTDELGNKYHGSLPVVIFGDHTRRVKYVDFEFAVGADGVKLLHPRAVLQPKFFYHYLRALKLDSQGYSRHYRFLKEIDVPIPPLNEQHRIVAKLEKLLSRVDAAQARLATIHRILKRFRQSVLAAACSGRLTADWREENPRGERATNTIEKLKATAGSKVRRGVPESVQASDLVGDWELPESWAAYSTAELLRCGAFVDVKDGNHGANHPKVSDFTKTGLPFVTAAQVNNYRIDYVGAYKLSGEPLDRIRVGFAKSGDVIYTHKGSVGRVAIADCDCVLTPQTTYYRVNTDVFSNRFVMFYLASHAFSDQVNVVKEQTTRDFVPISEQYLIFQRIPPLAEQQEIVRRVEALFKTADVLEARYSIARAYVDKLTQSILAKAFRGELVPQDPNDESASVLVERLRQERNGTAPKKRGRRK